MEAAASIPRQLRLRNLGGIIVIDFIDMQDPGHQEAVLAKLQETLDRDPAKSQVEGFFVFGTGSIEPEAYERKSVASHVRRL